MQSGIQGVLVLLLVLAKESKQNVIIANVLTSTQSSTNYHFVIISFSI